MASISWLNKAHNAVITGGASGIGLAAAQQFLEAGMRVIIADTNEEALANAVDQLQAGEQLLTFCCDVADLTQVQSLQTFAAEQLGDIHCLMNNAGAGLPPSLPWENVETWRKQVDINLWGIIHGCQAFLPGMISANQPGAVINTGSKQGITNPPGNYAYNLSKAGVKAYTESVAHALRELDGCRFSAHLLIPGFTFTGMIARFVKQQPPGAWTPEQVVDFMLMAIERGDFYLLCPDNETPRGLDEKRIQWQTDDLIHNRSALSRWDPAYQAAYEQFVKDQ